MSTSPLSSGRALLRRIRKFFDECAKHGYPPLVYEVSASGEVNMGELWEINQCHS